MRTAIPRATSSKEHYRGDPKQAILYQCAIEYDAHRRTLGTALLEHAISLCPSETRLASAYIDRPGGRAETAAPKQLEEPAPPPPRTERKSRRPQVKNDARLAAMARELRDRYLEQVNSGAIELDHGAAKYEVGRGVEEHAAARLAASSRPRSVEESGASSGAPMRLLEAA